jgi:hypothetical protein
LDAHRHTPWLKVVTYIIETVFGGFFHHIIILMPIAAGGNILTPFLCCRKKIDFFTAFAFGEYWWEHCGSIGGRYKLMN